MKDIYSLCLIYDKVLFLRRHIFYINNIHLIFQLPLFLQESCMLTLTTDSKYAMFILGDTAQISLPLGGIPGSPWGECPSVSLSYSVHTCAMTLISLPLLPDKKHLMLFSQVLGELHKIDMRLLRFAE